MTPRNHSTPLVYSSLCPPCIAVTSFRVAGGEASEQVVDALEGRGEMATTEGNAGLVALLSSYRMLDLTSRLRRDLQTEGVVISEMGKASSGRHTVMTLRLPSGAKSALEQWDARLQVSISFV